VSLKACCRAESGRPARRRVGKLGRQLGHGDIGLLDGLQKKDVGVVAILAWRRPPQAAGSKLPRVRTAFINVHYEGSRRAGA